MPDDDVTVEIAAQAGFESMRDISAEEHPDWWTGMPWNWEDQTPALREEWRTTARKMLAAVETHEDIRDSEIAKSRLSENLTRPMWPRIREWWGKL